MNRRGFLLGGLFTAVPASALASAAASNHRVLGDGDRPWVIISVRGHPLFDTPQPAYVIYDGPDGIEAANAEKFAMRAYNGNAYAFFSSWKGPYYKRYEGLPR